MWTAADRRLGVLSAAAVGLLGLLYVATGLAGVAMRPEGLPLLAQVDPYLAILEILIILSAVALVVMMAAVQAFAPPGRKTCARAALAFALAFAALTTATHFASLTIGRQLSATDPDLVDQLGFEWPSVNLALDLLAWDLFLGLALLFLAPVFRGGGLSGAVRSTAWIAGALCLIGTIAPLTGNMQIQFAAITGYAFILPALCTMIAILFARSPAEPPHSDSPLP